MKADNVCMVLGGLYEGLGLACAVRLAEDGHPVAIVHRESTSRPSEQVKSVTDAICTLFTRAGWPLSVIRCDTSRRDALEEVVADIERDLGAIDIVISAEGTNAYPPRDLIDLAVEDWDRAIRREVGAEISLLGAVLPRMRERRRGCIINFGYHRKYWENHLPFREGHALWTNSWPFVLGKEWRKRLVEELAPSEYRYGITLNTISPGRVTNLRLEDLSTGTRPSGDRATSMDVAAVAQFLCSGPGRIITGADIPALNTPFVYRFSPS